MWFTYTYGAPSRPEKHALRHADEMHARYDVDQKGSPVLPHAVTSRNSEGFSSRPGMCQRFKTVYKSREREGGRGRESEKGRAKEKDTEGERESKKERESECGQ